MSHSRPNAILLLPPGRSERVLVFRHGPSQGRVCRPLLVAQRWGAVPGSAGSAASVYRDVPHFRNCPPWRDSLRKIPTGAIKIMSTSRCTHSYRFHGLNLRVLSSAAIATCLNSRFQILASKEESPETIFFDFESVSHTKRHRFGKPSGQARPFYRLESGDASYFAAEDQIYLCCDDRVRVLCDPGSGSAWFSVLEPEIENLWLASHLLLTICLIEILKRRGLYSLHAGGFSANGKCLLIPGTSGVGKSTLTVASLRAKFDYMSDDMVFLVDRPDGFRVLAFPEAVDVSDQTAAFFPELNFLLHSPKRRGWRKRQIHPTQVY